MIYVGIDVAKDKHDCFIINSDGEVLYDVFTIQNNIDGFNDLLFKIKTAEQNSDKVKVGLEATGHYSCNILSLYSDVPEACAIDVIRHEYAHYYADVVMGYNHGHGALFKAACHIVGANPSI
jgi:hypothetical protein|nr:MAG TPA: transposase [Caudoviricetes sp.]